MLIIYCARREPLEATMSNIILGFNIFFNTYVSNLGLDCDTKGLI